MAIILTYILLIIAIFMIIITFMMSPTFNSFSGALVGSSDLDLFKTIKERGFNKWIKRIMFRLGLTTMIISIVIRVLV